MPPSFDGRLHRGALITQAVWLLGVDVVFTVRPALAGSVALVMPVPEQVFGGP